MNIHVTPTAAEKITELLAEENKTDAGLRVFDIRNKFRPEEVGFFIPPAPEGQKAPMFNDLYVDTDGLIYVTDRIKGGLYVLEYTGPKIQ